MSAYSFDAQAELLKIEGYNAKPSPQKSADRPLSETIDFTAVPQIPQSPQDGFSKSNQNKNKSTDNLMNQAIEQAFNLISDRHYCFDLKTELLKTQTFPADSADSADLHIGGAFPVANRLRTNADNDLSLVTKEVNINTNPKLNHFQDRGIQAGSLADLYSVLHEFSWCDWTLLERSAMSSAYTQVANELIEVEQADKWKTLQELDYLCQVRTTYDGRVNIEPLELHYPNSLPASTCKWVIDAFKAAPPDEQKGWWLGLAKWIGEYKDTAWACSIYDQLTKAWDEHIERESVK